MPAQKQASITSADNMLKLPDTLNLERSDSLRDIKPVSIILDNVPEPSSPTTDKSSWNLLKKLFKENKPSNSLKRQDAFDEKNNNTSRRFSVDQTSSSPLSRRRDSVTNRSSIKRKTSAGSKRTRKFSTANSQENLLHYAVIEDDIIILTEVLEQKKVDINHMRPPGVSALHEACVTGSIEAVQLLLLNNADIHLKTSSGISTLQIATLFGHFEVAQYLIQEGGANPKDIQNGFTHDIKLMSTILIR